jgi:3-isopropylmalate/(R)-2-methylmalate dehydratase small subunit
MCDEPWLIDPMEPFRRHRGVAVPFDERNVDTDQIVPSRYLLKPRAFDHAPLLFHDRRQRDSGAEPFMLDQPAYRGASILVGNENFGCGSSREQAAYALYDFGIRVVIAPSFGDIFRINCVKNGVLPAQVDNEIAGVLRQRSRFNPGVLYAVDLEVRKIWDDVGQAHDFAIDRSLQGQLLSGEDEISRTQKFQQLIDDFEQRWEKSTTWAKPGKG